MEGWRDDGGRELAGLEGWMEDWRVCRNRRVRRHGLQAGKVKDKGPEGSRNRRV